MEQKDGGNSVKMNECPNWLVKNIKKNFHPKKLRMRREFQVSLSLNSPGKLTLSVTDEIKFCQHAKIKCDLCNGVNFTLVN